MPNFFRIFFSSFGDCPLPLSRCRIVLQWYFKYMKVKVWNISALFRGGPTIAADGQAFKHNRAISVQASGFHFEAFWFKSSHRESFTLKNIARGTMDPEIDSVTWIKFSDHKAWSADGATCISYKFGHQMAPLALVPNLTTRWRNLQ